MCTDADKGDDGFLVIEPSCMKTADNSNAKALMDLLANGSQLRREFFAQWEISFADLLGLNSLHCIIVRYDRRAMAVIDFLHLIDITADRTSETSAAVRLTTYLVGSSSEFFQTIGPSTEGASLSGAEPNEEMLRRDSADDLALKLEIDIVNIS